MQSYKKMYELFIDISNNILSETSLVVSNKYKWNGKAKTRADFLDFLKLNTNMSHNEIKKEFSVQLIQALMQHILILKE